MPQTFEITPRPIDLALKKREDAWEKSLTPPDAQYATALDKWPELVAATIDADIKAGGQARQDSWENLLTGVGTTRDKITQSGFGQDGQLNFSLLEALYHNDDMSATICDAVPAQMFREGFELDIEDPEAAEAIEEALENLETATKFEEGSVWGRLYGGAKCLIGADDGQDANKPLNEKGIKTVDFLEVFDRYSLFPWSFYQDPKKPNYGTPETYKIMIPNTVNPLGALQFPAGSEVHESRMISFEGARTSIRKKRANFGWDDSVLQRVYQVLQAYGLQWASITNLLSDASQGVLSVKGLIEMLAQGNKDLLMARGQVIDMSRSSARMMLIDSDAEKFERVPTPFAGVPELTDRLTQRLAAAAGMPVTVLMGEAPAGLNATGDSDIRNWYDKIAGLQRKTLAPKMKRLIKILMAAKEGPTAGKVYDKFKVNFNSLWQLTPVEEATRRFQIAQADQIYLVNGVATSEEIATSRFRARGYNPDTRVDLDLRDELMKGDKQATQLEGGKPDAPPEGHMVDPKTGETIPNPVIAGAPAPKVAPPKAA